MKHSKAFWLLTIAAVTLVVIAASSFDDEDYQATVEQWQSERQADLQKDESWLTVAGLYWLREGENWVGSDAVNDFVLPESAPPVVGVFEFEERRATFRARDGVTVTQDGKPVSSVELEMGAKHALRINPDLTMWLHYSGDRLAIRLRDLNAAFRKDFTGLKWFPVDPTYRVKAAFTPHAAPKTVEVLNILGDIERYESPGYVDFELQGKSIRMEPLTSGERLWFIFRDATSGKETYPAARFLRADAPENGEVVIDFNRAYNPPCAYNPYTTCPMPTKQNRLSIRIAAGEKNYKKSDS